MYNNDNRDHSNLFDTKYTDTTEETERARRKHWEFQDYLVLEIRLVPGDGEFLKKSLRKADSMDAPVPAKKAKGEPLTTSTPVTPAGKRRQRQQSLP